VDDGFEVTGMARLQALPRDDDGSTAETVELRIGDQAVAQAQEEPWELTWDTTGLDNGPVEIQVVASKANDAQAELTLTAVVNNCDPNDIEICDGEDNDCDGVVDEDPIALCPGAARACIGGACDDAPTCTAPQQTCFPYTLSSDTLVCAVADSTRPDELRCLQRCEVQEDCSSGVGCLFVDDAQIDAACTVSNCSSPFASAQECEGASPFGGTCYPFFNDAFFCGEAGPGAAGEVCVENTDCGPGLECALNLCQPRCSLDDDSRPCPDGLECSDVVEEGDYGLCLETCSGFGDDSCSEGFGCLPFSETESYCLAAGDAEVGKLCEPGGCVVGSLCQGQGNGPDTCRALCDLAEGDAGCDPGELCLANTEVRGTCYASCTPFTENTGCDGELCLPVEGQDRAACLPAGDIPLGDPCISNGDASGTCVPEAVCIAAETDPDNPQFETCATLCRPFAPGQPNGCDDAEVCATSTGGDWGYCTPNAINPPLAPLETCTADNIGRWCDDDVLCFRIEGQIDGVCLELCRASVGNPDCNPGSICNLEQLADPNFGICLRSN
ncbi:MAG: Ig-like domain-containing protein, partial [Myxococcota bacterium]